MSFCLQFFAWGFCDREATPSVVPANAGTHNHRHWRWRESRRTASLKTSDTAYGSLRSQGRHQLINRIAERVDDRFQDRNHRRQFPEIGPIAVARAVVEFFG